MKKIALLFTLVLVLLLATACRDNNENGADEQPETPAVTTPDAPATPNPTPADDPPEADAPATGLIRDIGRDIRIICWWQYMPNTTDPEPDPATSANYLNARAWWDNQVRVQEAYNVTFTNVSMGRPDIMEPLMASVMAGDPIAELVMLGDEHMIPAITGNLIMTASQFAAPNSDMLNSRIFVRPLVEFQNEIWAFGRVELSTQGAGLGINLDLINAIGAPNPVTLWENGQWTWDAMRDIMRMASRDTTGDGVFDQFGLGGNIDAVAHQLLATNNARMVNPDTMEYSFDEPNAMEALEFMYEIFSNRWWHYDQHSYNPMGNWSRDHGAFWDGNTAMFMTATWVFENGNFPSFEHSVVPWPQGPSGVGYTSLGGFPQGMTIPQGNSNPQDIFMLYEELQSWARYDMDMMTMGAYDYTRRSWLTEEDVYRVLHHIGNPDRQMFCIGMAIPDYPWVVNSFVRHFFEGTMTVSQAVEAYRPPSQERIDAIFR